MGRHVLPNVLAPIIVQGALYVSGAIITEAGLSFLGLGALFMSKILAPLLIGLFDGNLSPVFYALAGIFIVLTLVPARFMVNPSEGFAPKGSAAPKPTGAATINSR